MLCESAPKTAPREGMGMSFLEVVVGMLGSCRDGAARAVRVRERWARALLGQRRWCARAGPGFADSKEGLRADERLARQAGQRGALQYCTGKAEAEAEAEAEEQ